MPNLLVRLALFSILVGPWPAAAQNLLPNPDANTNASFWDNGGYPGSIFWYPTDSRGCPGSGSVFIQCFDVSEIVSTCVPYSAGAIFVGFDVSGTEKVETQANIRILIYMFDDPECESLLDVGESSFGNTEVTQEFRRFETDNQTLPSTQSVRLRLQVESPHCGAKVSDGLLFFDTFYLGTSERIVAHDFENGDVCPLSTTG